METLSVLLACKGNHLSLMESHHKVKKMWTFLMFLLIAWMNCWTNHCVSSDSICLSMTVIFWCSSTFLHYIDNGRLIVNWLLMNKFQWNFNWNNNIFIHENAFKIIVSTMSAILAQTIRISRKFVPNGPIHNVPSLVQIMLAVSQATSHYLNQWW